MGNYIEKGLPNIRSANAVPNTQIPQQLSNSIEVTSEFGESLCYYIYSYKENMQQKERQLMKWATSKLALTEELIRSNEQHSAVSSITHLMDVDKENRAPIVGGRKDDDNDDEDEDDVEDDDDVDADIAGREMAHLKNYRIKLLELLCHLKKARNRKKGKRLKRKKLLNKCATLSGVNMKLFNLKRSRKATIKL